MRNGLPDRRPAWSRRLDRVRVELESAPDRGTLWLKRARLQWMLGEWASAHRSIARAVELDPRSSLVHAWRARMAVESRDFDEALEPLVRAAELDPRDATVRWIRGRWGLDLARVARERGELATARELLAHVDRSIVAPGIVELERTWLDEIDPKRSESDASARRRRLRFVELARGDESRRRVAIEAIRERNATYRAITRLSDAFDGRAGKVRALALAAVAVVATFAGGRNGGWRFLEGSAGDVPEGSSTLWCCVQAVAMAALLVLVALREHKAVFLARHLGAYWLVDEERYPGLLTDEERATGMRCTLYVLAPIAAAVMLSLPDRGGALAFPLILGAIPLYQWKRMEPGWSATAFGACTIAAALAIVAEAIGAREPDALVALSPWYGVAIAWMLASLPIGVVLRRHAARAA